MGHEFKIELDENTVHKINEFVQLQNSLDFLSNKRSYSIEDFIKGSVSVTTNYFLHFYDLVDDLPNQNIKIRNNFAQISKEKGISQRYISEKTGINVTNLNLIFKNKVQPRMDMFFKVWIVLGCPPIHKTIYKVIED